MDRMLIGLAVMVSLAGVAFAEPTLEEVSAEAGTHFDLGALRAKPSAVAALNAAAGAEARGKPGVAFSLLEKRARIGVPSIAKKTVPAKSADSARQHGLAANLFAGAVGAGAAAFSAFFGAAYAATIVLPAIAAGVQQDEPGERRTYGQILLDHLLSPVNWGVAAFRRGKARTLDAMTRSLD